MISITYFALGNVCEVQSDELNTAQSQQLDAYVRDMLAAQCVNGEYTGSNEKAFEVAKTGVRNMKGMVKDLHVAIDRRVRVMH